MSTTPITFDPKTVVGLDDKPIPPVTFDSSTVVGLDDKPIPPVTFDSKTAVGLDDKPLSNAPANPYADANTTSMSGVAGADPGMQSPQQAAGIASRQMNEITPIGALTNARELNPQELSQPLTGASMEASTMGGAKTPLENWHPVDAAKQAGYGVKDLAEGLAPAVAPAMGMRDKVKPGQQVDPSLAARGGTKLIGSAMEAGKPLMMAGVQAAPLKMAAGYIAGVLAGNSAAAVAQKMGLSPEEVEFIHTAAFFLPNVMADVMSLKGGAGDTTAKVLDADGNVKEVPIKAGAVTGRGFQAGVGRDENGGIYAAGRVGPFSVRAKWGGTPESAPTPTAGNESPAQPSGPVRGLLPAESQDPTANLGTPQAPDPVQMMASEKAQTIAEVAQRASSTEKAAAGIAMGIPPPPPPSIPKPAGMDTGALTTATADRMGHIIQMIPESMRPRAILESVGNLADWLFGKKTVIGPDGKVASVDTPQLAQKAAVSIVNNEVDRQTQKAADAQQQQQDAQAQQQEEAEEARTEREEALSKAPAKTATEVPDNPHTQLARRILGSLPDNTPAAKMDQALRDKILLPTPIRTALVAEEVQHRAQLQETKAQETMTGKPTPEGQQPHEIDKWIDGVKKGEEPFAHIQKETTYKPKDVEGLTRTTVKGAKDADGIYYHDPEVSSADIRKAARGGTLDQLREAWKSGKAPAGNGSQEAGGSPEAKPQAENAPQSEAVQESPRTLTPFEGAEGKRTQIHLADESSIPARHRIVELSSLVASHQGPNFTPNPHYPPRVQERSYESSKAEQMKVQSQAQDFKPELIVNTDPTAQTGAPIVTSKPVTIDGTTYPAGTVLGGNSRAMTLEHVYTNGAEAPYREALLENHRAFGFPPEVLEGFNQPVHVREVEPPTTLEEMHRIGSLLNKSHTQSLDAFDQAVSLGKQLSPDTLTGIGDIIREASDADSTATLNAVLTNPKTGRQIVKMLETDGIITERNRPQFVDPSTTLLTMAARNQLGNSLLANLLDSRDLMEKTPAILKQKLLGTIGSISAITAQDDGWNIAPAMREAVKQYGALSRMMDVDLNAALEQGAMFDEQRGPVVDTLIRKFDQNVGELRKAFSLYTTGADEGRNPSGMLVGLTENPDPYLDFNFAFGTELTKEQFDQEMKALRGKSAEPTDGITQTAPAETKAAEVETKQPEAEPTHVYAAEVSKFAGDPNPKKVTIEAQNRRHAESLLAEKYPGTRISDPYRIATKEAVAAAPQGEVLPPAAAAERPFKKDDKVTYTTNAGKQRAGTVAFGDDRIVRIRDARTGSVITKKKADVQHAGEPVAAAVAPVEAPKVEVKTASLIDHIGGYLKGNHGPENYNDLKQLVKNFDGKEPDQLRMKQAQEAYEAALMNHASQVAQQANSSHAFNNLVALYEGQPNMAIRTSSSITNQAYSTPAPLAFIADKFAGIGKSGDVYEPTAGNGMLLLGVPKANRPDVWANEIGEDRKANLSELGFSTTANDASKWTPQEKFDSVVMNPPFAALPGPVDFDGYQINKLDHLIVLKALSAMKDGGKASIIIGATKEPGEVAAKDKPFFNYLYSRYNVVADFELDGDMYSRQGASWPVRVLAVDGRARSAKVIPPASSIERLSTWENVYDTASQHLGPNLEGQRRADVEPAGEVRGAGAGPAAVQGTSGAGDSLAGGSGQETSPQGYRGNIGSGQPGPVVHTGGVPTPGVGSPDNVVASDGDVAASDRLAEDQPRPKAVRREPSKLAGHSGDASVIADESSNQFQSVYTPFSEKKDVNVLAPKAMVSAMHAAMVRLSDVVGDLDQYVTDELGYSDIEEMQKAFMGLQVDTVAGAIAAIQRGKGIIIADQTGVGKGRQAAAVIRWAEMHGHTPIFITAKPNLFSDMYSDLNDIGSANAINPLLMNADATITHPVTGEKVLGNKPKEHTQNLQRILETGKLPTGRNALFLTYSQINKANRQQMILQRLAPNAIFILDEAHKAGGESATGLFMRGLLGQAKAATFLSATYAKRPDNLPLYSDMTSISLAIPDKDKIVSAIQAGGAPLQAVVSYQLAQAGELFRRERSFDGISFPTHVFEDRQAEHEKISDDVTEVLRAIVDADSSFHENDFGDIKEEIEGEGGTAMVGGNQASKTVFHAEFTSVVHNAIKQLLLGLKADDVADKVIADIENGVKPIIALESTMGSFLTHYVESNGLQKGAPLHNFTYGNVLQRSLDRTRYYNLTDMEGKKTRVEVPVESLSDGTQALYAQAQSLIRKLRVNVPVSPIDWIKNRVKQAGHTIAEVTGRDYAIDYSREVPTLTTVDDAERHDRVATVNGYNNGGVDSMVLNQAGSTGLSAHASEKFKDRRPRKMYVVQPQGDINEQMQIFGRINRTGQVLLPQYEISATALPAEIRPAMVLSAKLKSLNANTSSNTRSAMSIESPDMMNKYGDMVVQQYLNENPAMAAELRMSSNDDDEDDAGENIARKATGRAALLPVAEQNEFMASISEAYKDYITYLDDTGQNDLEPKTYDFEAEPLAKPSVLYQGADKSNPFGQDAHFAEYRIKRQGKPYTPAEVKEMVQSGLRGAKNDVEFHRNLVAELDKNYQPFLDRQTAGSSRERAINTKQATSQFMMSYRVGSGARVEINGEMYNGIVVGIEPAKKPAGNPFALSSIKFEVALNSPVRSIKVSGTELSKIIVGPLGPRADVDYLFHDANPNAKMIAKIITGNLLGAYGALKNVKGRIISFTMQDGSSQVGILMPGKFDPKVNVANEYCLRTAEGVQKTVQAHRNEGPAVMAPGGDVVLQREGPGMIIKTKMSKAVGGRFFKDLSLLSHITQGEFYSRGGMMVGHVIPGQEKAAIQIVMSKIALYATSSMIDQAREFDQQTTAAKPSLASKLMSEEGGTSSAGIPPAAAEYIQKAVPATWNEITKGVRASGKSARKIGYEFMAAFSPSSLADTDAKDIMGHAIGEPALRMFEAAQLLRGVEKMFKAMPQEKWVEAHTRKQTGRGQASTDLQNAYDLMDRILEQQRQRENEAINLGRSEDDQVELTDRPNYAPNRYSKPPSNDLIPSEDERVARIGASRRPFEGSKAFTKKQSYTLKDAVDKGAVPLGTPVDMLMRRLQEGAKFVAARYAMHNFREQGLVTFLKNGKKLPEGYVEISDKIGKVWRPVETEKGSTVFVQSGKWIIQQDAGRLLNNYLSTDHIRGTEIGTALLNLKGASTAMKLGFSLFHYANIGIETMASGLQLGLDKIYNQGLRDFNPTKISAGLADIGKSISAPVSMAIQGHQMIKYVRNPDEFLASPEGEKFARDYPDFPHLLGLIFHGGLRMNMGEDFRGIENERFTMAMKEGRLGSAVLQFAPWIGHLVAAPLFQHYIPRIKMAFAVQMLSQKLEQYSQALAAGSITEESIAREVAATVDNRFGEFNWDSLYLNNTLRTAINLVFRAPGWQIGTWRGLSSAVAETFTSKAFDDRIFEKIDEESTKWDWAKDNARRLPQMGVNAGWMISKAFLVVMMGSVISKATTGKWPWELAEAAKNNFPRFANAALECLHPRIGGADQNGTPNRINFPTDFRVFEQAGTGPGRYAKGALADWLGNGFDTWQNRDFRDNYVYNPQDSAAKELLQGLAYNFKGDFEPISADNYRRGQDKPASDRALAFAGASGGKEPLLDESQALRHALQEKRPHDPYTPEQEEAYQLAQHQPPTRMQVLRAAREKNLTYLDKVVLHDLTYTQAMDIYNNYASPEEKQQLRPIIERKRTLEILKARRR